MFKHLFHTYVPQMFPHSFISNSLYIPIFSLCFLDLIFHLPIPISMDSTQIKNQAPQGPTSSFPVIAIVVLCIIATAFLLVSYYIFLTKCFCLHWQQFDPLRHFFRSRTRQIDDPFTAYSPTWQTRGLEESLIREIPVFYYNRREGEERSLHKCIVCLNDFQEQDKLRILPNCSHGFHLDCIDVWLQSNANCPLCRLSILGTTRVQTGQIIAPASSPQEPVTDNDFVMIEMSCEERAERSSLGNSRSHSWRKFGENKIVTKKAKERKFNDDDDDDQFSVKPIRRSFSMDSAADRQLYLSVQEILRQQNQGGSRSSILPIQF